MPTRDTAWSAGTPCWIDYNAADVDAAQAFYADLLGWTYTDGEPDYGGYLSCLSGGRAAAGMMPKMEPSQPTGWTTYFATDDADATVAAISSGGGKVHAAPMDVGPLGRMAIAADPQDHVFGLWQAREFGGIEIFNEPGALVWNEAAVADPEAARAFYSRVFGFRFQEVEGAGGYATFGISDDPLGGVGALQEGAPAGWSTCFMVAATDDAVAVVEKAGGSVITAAQDTPFGRFAVLRDPWGATFSVMQAPA